MICQTAKRMWCNKLNAKIQLQIGPPFPHTRSFLIKLICSYLNIGSCKLMICIFHTISQLHWRIPVSEEKKRYKNRDKHLVFFLIILIVISCVCCHHDAIIFTFIWNDDRDYIVLKTVWYWIFFLNSNLLTGVSTACIQIKLACSNLLLY